MKNILIDLENPVKKNISNLVVDTIEATSNIRFLNISKNVNYVDEDTYRPVCDYVANDNKQKNLLNKENINPSSIIDFVIGQGMHLSNKKIIGRVVNVKYFDSKTNYFDNFDGLIVDCRFGNNSYLQIVPIVYNTFLASENSLVVHSRPDNYYSNEKFTPFTLLTEFEIPIFLDSIEISQHLGKFGEKEINQILNFIDSRNFTLNNNIYRIGAPFVDFFDSRFKERSTISKDLFNISKSAQEFIRNENFVPHEDPVSYEVEKHYESFDVVLLNKENEFVSKNKKFTSDIQEFERMVKVG